VTHESSDTEGEKEVYVHEETASALGLELFQPISGHAAFENDDEIPIAFDRLALFDEAKARSLL